MKMKCLLTWIGLAIVLHLAAFQDLPVRTEIQKHLELEDVLSEQQLERQKRFPALENWVWRSEAQNLKVLRIEDTKREYSVNLRLCIKPNIPFQNVTIRVGNIRYSNDGPSDTCYLLLNGEEIGKFFTREKWASGYDWNVFENTGVVGDPKVLNRGQYILSLQVETDQWGVEFDRIAINAENQNETEPLICGSELAEPRRIPGFQ